MNKLFIFLAILLCHQIAFGMFRIHDAVELGTPEIVDAFIDAGADVNQFDGGKQTPLDRAVMRNDAAIVDLLLKRGADPNKSFSKTHTPLRTAVLENRGQIVHLLLDHGADATLDTGEGITSLHLAATNGYADIAASLLDHGADVNCLGYRYGWTPLHCAVDGGRLDIVRILLAHNADRNKKDKNGSEIPLDIAKRKGFTKIAELLTEWPRIVACANARLTLLLGLHPRVGAASSLQILNQYLLQLIAHDYMRPEYY